MRFHGGYALKNFNLIEFKIADLWSLLTLTLVLLNCFFCIFPSFETRIANTIPSFKLTKNNIFFLNRHFSKSIIWLTEHLRYITNVSSILFGLKFARNRIYKLNPRVDMRDIWQAVLDSSTITIQQCAVSGRNCMPLKKFNSIKL